jgi:hypothetical protein
MKTLLVCCALLALSPFAQLYARGVWYWTPDELWEKSSFICDGQVLDVAAVSGTGAKTDMREYSATIKVQSVEKGDSVDTLEFRYFNLVPERSVMDGPVEVHLTKGDKCRFYLNKDPKKPYYWGCLEGQLDDAQSVGRILIPDSNEDGNIRLFEIDREFENAENQVESTRVNKGAPDFQATETRVTTALLQLISKCESLAKADINQKIRQNTEDAIIRTLGEWKRRLAPDDSGTFETLLSQILPDPATRSRIADQVDAVSQR